MEILKSKKLIFVAVGLFLALVVVAIILFFAKGELTVYSNVENTQIIINNKTYNTPLIIRLRNGSYTVEASKEGYISDKKNVNLKAFQKSTISFKLISDEFVEPTKAEALPALHQLPHQEDHFRINWRDADPFTIEVVPNIPFDNNHPPTYFFETYWDQYQAYAQEGITWLRENGLDKQVRESVGLEIKWWGQEWWPEGANLDVDF